MGLPLALGLAFSGLLSGALISVAYLKFFRRRTIPCCSRRPPDDVERGTPDTHVVDAPDAPPEPAKAAVRRFGWADIESATGSFNPEAVIGEGGFSTVYLARLPDDSLAAVKVHRSSSCSERLHRAFRQELDTLLRVRHPHIVPLLGYCDDHEEGILVLEYVPGGSLHDKLHAGGGDVLPWAQRMSIASRLARAVDYLHEACDPQIVHGDITSANVLLDHQLDPKLCDFGSARTGFSAAVRPPSGRSGAPMVGSLGYADPHYLWTGIVSKKSDVYSFGVLLLELITGIPAFRPEEGRLLAAEMGPQGTGRWVVDPRLGGEYDAEEAAAMASVAALCIGDQPSLRPSMADVLRIMREKVPSVVSAIDGKSSGGMTGL